MRFAWDSRKAASNLRKHGVTFEEATTVFADPPALIVEDAVRSDRAVIIGESARRQILVAVFIEVAEDDARIISVRRATNHERSRYESGEEA